MRLCEHLLEMTDALYFVVEKCVQYPLCGAECGVFD